MAPKSHAGIKGRKKQQRDKHVKALIRCFVSFVAGASDTPLNHSVMVIHQGMQPIHKLIGSDSANRRYISELNGFCYGFYGR